MKYDKYKFKFYLNASHSIYIGGVLGQKHPHTWEFSIEVIQVLSGFVQFNEVEKEVERLLSKYQDSYINQIQPFNEINPTLENICIYFKEELKRLTGNVGWLLLNIEISETPSRSYIIDLVDEVDLNEVEKKVKNKRENIDVDLNEVVDKVFNDMIR